MGAIINVKVIGPTGWVFLKIGSGGAGGRGVISYLLITHSDLLLRNKLSGV